MTHLEYDGEKTLCGMFDEANDISSDKLTAVDCKECQEAAAILIEPEPDESSTRQAIDEVKVEEDVEAEVVPERKQFALGYEGGAGNKKAPEPVGEKPAKAKKAFKLVKVKASKADPLTDPEEAIKVDVKVTPVVRQSKANDIPKTLDKDRKRTAELGVQKVNLKRNEGVPRVPHAKNPEKQAKLDQPSNKAKLCKCGCGGYTKGGTFKPGHDSKFYAALAKKEGKKIAHGKK